MEVSRITVYCYNGVEISVNAHDYVVVPGLHLFAQVEFQ
jgi:hypothetical protein